VTQRSSGH